MTTQTTALGRASNLRHPYLMGHRILGMIAGVGFSLSLSAPPAQAQFCPLPAVNQWCLPFQTRDCLATVANETCLPREILFDGITAPPTILLCDCFSNTGDCGPVDIKPNLPPPGYTVSCPGNCPPGQACYVHLNLVSQEVSSIDSSQIPLGAVVTCGCEVIPPPPPCPLGNSWCVGLQSIDCNTTTVNETCLPREITIDPSGTGQPIILLCDCFENVPGCGPVNIVPNPTIGFTVSCPGPCPLPQTCQVHFNGVSQGVSSIDSSLIPPGTGVTCACDVPPPAVCPLPANQECAALQSSDCLSAAGTCLPKVIRHHIPVVAAFFPDAGPDVLTPTTGYVEILNPLGDAVRYYIRESPPNMTQVIRESPTVVGGHREIAMELVAMELVGVAGGGGGGGGGSAVQIRESPTRASMGRVTGAVSGVTDYPADSFFDLFVEIDIPELGVTGLYNALPIPLEARGIMAVPPLGASFKTLQSWSGVELLESHGYPTGYVIREVVHELPPPPPPPEWEVILCACIDPLACHVTRDLTVNPVCVGVCPPGDDCIQFITSIDPNTEDYSCECVPQPLEACCFVDGHCEMRTASDCRLIDGTPKGPGTMCLGDLSGNGIDDACETLDKVVCEPQDGINNNPFHPSTYWYDVTPSGFGRCDFHVLVLDSNASNYTGWTITPWPGNTWVFNVHQVGTETWASWYTPNCGQPLSVGTTYRFQFSHSGPSTWSKWRTTYSGNNNPYDPYTFDTSDNHPGEADGYGYRVHVPQPLPGVSKWDQWPNPALPGLHAADGVTLADNWMCQGGLVTDFHFWGNYELDDHGQERRGAGIQCINISIHKNQPNSPWCLPQDPALWGVCAFFDALHEYDTGLVNSDGSKIYLYEFYLQPGFDQVQGEIYWLDIEAQSANPLNPTMWRWQENSRDDTPQLCPAAERTLPPPPFMWQSITWLGDPPRYSEMAFRVTSTLSNEIVWDPATNPTPWPNTNPLATTRSLRFRVVAPTPGGPSKVDAIKVTMVDLQHPNPRNSPQSPPANYTTFDTRSNGVCSGGQFNGHHCDTDADCTGTTNGTCTPRAACTAMSEGNGCARWVGKPGTFYESEGPPQSGPYRAARLQCTPFYWDWKSEPGWLVTVVGAEIVPSSEYSVQAYAASCMGTEDTCIDKSAPVTMYTRRSGDVDVPYNPGSLPLTNQPNASDIAQLVNKFKNLLGAPVKARAQLQPNLPELNASINALDIVAVVDAFKGLAYAFSGPCPCPSTQTCGLTCTGCAGMCVKTCIGGDNAGQPCIGPAHCPGGACSTTGTCRDKCGRCTPP